MATNTAARADPFYRSPVVRHSKGMWRVLLLMLGLCAMAGCPSSTSTPVEPEPTPPDAGDTALPDRAIRVMTYNVERLFDPVCDSGDCGFGSYEALPDETRFFAHARRVAQGIEVQDADLVLLQEVENQNGLDAIQSELQEPFSAAVLGEQGRPATVDVAVLARGEILDVVRHQWDPIPLDNGGTTTFAREFLQVHLDMRGAHVIVFVAHFKSKANDDPDRRLAEARAAHRIVRGVAAQHPDALVIFGGDLNDTPSSLPIVTLIADGTLDRVASELGDQAATYSYRQAPLAIDHLFVATTASGRFVDDTAEVVGFPDGYYGSDHAALLGWFELPPAVFTTPLDVDDMPWEWPSR